MLLEPFFESQKFEYKFQASLLKFCIDPFTFNEINEESLKFFFWTRENFKILKSLFCIWNKKIVFKNFFNSKNWHSLSSNKKLYEKVIMQFWTIPLSLPCQNFLSFYFHSPSSFLSPVHAIFAILQKTILATQKQPFFNAIKLHKQKSKMRAGAIISSPFKV